MRPCWHARVHERRRDYCCPVSQGGQCAAARSSTAMAASAVASQAREASATQHEPATWWVPHRHNSCRLFASTAGMQRVSCASPVPALPPGMLPAAPAPRERLAAARLTVGIAGIAASSGCGGIIFGRQSLMLPPDAAGLPSASAIGPAARAWGEYRPPDVQLPQAASTWQFGVQAARPGGGASALPLPSRPPAPPQSFCHSSPGTLHSVHRTHGGPLPSTQQAARERVVLDFGHGRATPVFGAPGALIGTFQRPYLAFLASRRWPWRGCLIVRLDDSSGQSVAPVATSWRAGRDG